MAHDKQGLLSGNSTRGLLAIGAGIGLGIAGTHLWNRARKPKDIMKDLDAGINRTQQLLTSGQLHPRKVFRSVVAPVVEDIFPEYP